MQSFHPYTLRCLREAGWFSGRNVDPRPFLSRAGVADLGADTVIARFFAEFGGLIVKYVRRRSPVRPSPLDVFRFDPRYAPNMEADDYSAYLSKEVVPIGDAFRYHANLMMDMSGYVYGSVDSEVFLVGERSTAAIDNLCLDREMPKIADIRR